MWDRGASDLLLTAGAPPLLRIDGEMVPLPDSAPFRPEELEAILDAVLTEDLARRFRADKEIDFSFNWRSLARFRANAFFQRGSMGLAVRVIPYRIPSFEDLGLPAVVERFVNLPHGLILVTGPTGCGKSTSLASMIEHINEHRACHILTIEDPVEYVYRHKRSAVNQREIGEDTQSFERALRSALREDPDVLLIGEMRDLETIRIALTIAETGHLVFATLHTNDTAQAIDRIVDVFPADHQAQIRVQLAASLQGIIYQELIPKLGGGRVAAFEVLIANHAIRAMIKDGKTNQIRNVVSMTQREGMQTLETSLTDLVARGLLDYGQATERSLHPTEIKRPGPTPVAIPPEQGRRRR